MWELVEENHVSIGTIISYMGNAVPERFLACDGTIYNIADYQSLADHINIEFGSYNHFGGDGTTTFAVPDLRGEFLRGTGTNSHSNSGSGSSVGVHQAPSIIHAPRADSSRNVVFAYNTGSNINYAVNYDTKVSDSNIGANRILFFAPPNTNAVENNSYTLRPTNTSVLYCIKYI